MLLVYRLMVLFLLWFGFSPDRVPHSWGTVVKGESELGNKSFQLDPNTRPDFVPPIQGKLSDPLGFNHFLHVDWFHGLTMHEPC
jgi:hypothetical protein